MKTTTKTQTRRKNQKAGKPDDLKAGPLAFWLSGLLAFRSSAFVVENSIVLTT